MSDVVIKVGGTDITDDVIFADAVFQTQVSGSPGTCQFRIKDMKYAYSLTVGDTLTLDVDGIRVWGGWVQSVDRQFFFPYGMAPGQRGAANNRSHSPSPLVDPCAGAGNGGSGGGIEPIMTVPRALVVNGIDYNILFRKRFTFDKDKPANVELKAWPAGTSDKTQIEWLCANDLDLSGDGIDYMTKVESIGQPNPDSRGNPAAGGWKWEDAMNALTRFTGAIYYIDPEKYLILTDVDTPNAEHSLSDTPDGGTYRGYREMEILYNGSNLVNDSMVWGAGQGSKHVVFSRSRDGGSISSHGLWQVGDFRGEIWRQASVDKRARSFVYGSPQNKRGGKDDAISIQVGLFEPVFKVAQKVHFLSGVYGYDDVIPIRRMKITFKSPTIVRFDLTLSHAIDEPWDTFEYWFPKIKLPRIVIPKVNPYLTCPNPNLPDSYPPMNNLIPVFSDDFLRASGQPNDGECGNWSNSNGVIQSPTIVPHSGLQVGTNSILLNNPVGGEIVIIAAFSAVGVGSTLTITAGSLFVSLASLSNGTRAIVGNATLTTDRTTVEDTSSKRRYVLRGRFFIRAAWVPGAGQYLKIWSQGDVEPRSWTVTNAETRDPSTAFGSRATEIIKFTGPSNTYMQAISVWTDGSSSVGSVGSMAQPMPPYSTTTPFGNMNGWRHWWPSDPMPSGAYFSDNTLTEGSVQDRGAGASVGFGVEWGYFGGPMWVAGKGNNTSWFYFADRSFPTNMSLDQRRVTPAPTSVKLRGRVIFRASGTPFGGWLSSREPWPTQATIEVYVLRKWTDPFWLGEGYWAPLADPVNTLYFKQFISYGNQLQVDRVVPRPPWVDTSLAFKDDGEVTTRENDIQYFEGEIPLSGDTQLFQSGGLTYSYTGFSLAIRIWDARGVMTHSNWSGIGGPFMFPNTGDMTASVAIEAEIGGYWLPVSCGSHFCDPSGYQGSTVEQRNCETFNVDPVVVRESIAQGENWTIMLATGYKVGSVMVFADGMPLKPALDYIELDNLTGTISFLNSLYNVESITVCYFPE